MLKSAAVSLALVLAVGCASTPAANSGNGGTSASVAAAVSAPRDYVLLSSPSQVRSLDFSNLPYDFHVRGTLTNKGFIPAGQVEGRGKLCTDGKDWLSLSDLKVRKASEGAPAAPYILGCASGSSFQPASRDIVMQ